MSASAKLKALVEGFFEDTEPSGYEAPVEVIRALAQIVAVVEAAEKQADLVKDEEIEWRWPGLAESLAALDEALGEASV